MLHHSISLMKKFVSIDTIHKHTQETRQIVNPKVYLLYKLHQNRLILVQLEIQAPKQLVKRRI